MRRRLRRRPAPPRVLTPKSTTRKPPGLTTRGLCVWFCLEKLGRMDSARKAVFVLVPTGNPPSLRFGHPDVTFGRYRLSSLGHCAGAAAFSGCALRVSARTLSAAKQGGAERPGDGCPCVGAEEICGAPPPLVRGKERGRSPAPPALSRRKYAAPRLRW